MMTALSEEMKSKARVPYALRRVPQENLSCLLPCSEPPQPSDIALAKVKKIGRNTNLELPSGRRCALYVGDLMVAVFGNRYATMQFEGYAKTDGERCDLLSMAGVCGLVETKHRVLLRVSASHLFRRLSITRPRRAMASATGFIAHSAAVGWQLPSRRYDLPEFEP